MFRNKEEYYEIIDLFSNKIDINTENIKVTKRHNLYVLKGYMIVTNKKDSSTITINVTNPIGEKEDLSTNEKLIEFCRLVIAYNCIWSSCETEDMNTMCKIFGDDGKELYLNKRKIYDFIMKAIKQ